MSFKIYKEQATGLLVFGDRIIASGQISMETNATLEVRFKYGENSNIINMAFMPVSEYVKENGAPYASMTELKLALVDFFLKASRGGGSIGTYTRPADWLKIDSLSALGQQKAVALFAVYQNVNDLGMTNTCALSATGNFTVNWGDGTITNHSSDATAEHVFDYTLISAGTLSTRGYRQAVITITPQAGQNLTTVNFGRKHSTVVFGSYTAQWIDILISGTLLTKATFTGSVSKSNLLEVIKILQSSTEYTNMDGMFASCLALQSLNLSSFNTSAITNMYSMFASCTALQSLNLSSFNTSAVTNMDGMFYNCLALQSLNLSSFNTSAVTNMAIMFYNCTALQSLNLSSFNTSAVTNMDGMFYNCTALQSLNLSSFNTSAVTNMGAMFQNCLSLQKIDLSQTILSTITTGNFGNFLGGNSSLIKCRIPQVKWSFTIANNPMSAAELNLLFGDLATTTGQTITITDCTGAATANKTIATAKGWTVTG